MFLFQFLQKVKFLLLFRINHKHHKAKEKGLEVIDASCLDVIKTHDLIQDKLNEGYEILYIGKKGHPEAEGAISIDEKRIHLITNIDDLKTIDPTKKYVMTNQTRGINYFKTFFFRFIKYFLTCSMSSNNDFSFIDFI